MLSIAWLAVLAHPAVGANRMTAAALAAVRRPQINMAFRTHAAGKIIGAAKLNSFGFRFWIFGKITHDSSGDAGRGQLEDRSEASKYRNLRG